MSESSHSLVRKLKEHSRLSQDDVDAVRSLPMTSRPLASGEDCVRQGDRPDHSVLVVEGILARYHLLEDGRRQYLSFHLAGDMPDSQALFVNRMDHAVCGIGSAVVASIPHKNLLRMFDRRPSITMAIWRETLIDAAIFREAITNNSTRDVTPRMAHLFCELFYRARASKLTKGPEMAFPIRLQQLGETLGMAIATVNRTLQELRGSGSVDFRNNRLIVNNWDRLSEIGTFDPSYLHLRRPPAI